jgi:hypothetical protein
VTERRRPELECAVRRIRILTITCLAAIAAGIGCRRPGDTPPPSAVPPPPPGSPAPPAERTDTAISLPDALGAFAAVDAPARGPGWVRRSYRRRHVQIEVTLARTVLPPGGFEAWLAMSEGYPQAKLDAPASDANGFYQCVSFPMSSCDLLVQLRSGVHIELRGNGSSSRADVDALAAALSLRSLAASSSGAP